MKHIIQTILVILAHSCLNCQVTDSKWLLGSRGSFDPNGFYQATIMTFGDTAMVVSLGDRLISVDCANISMCDSSGSLVFYSNGLYIMNSKNDLIPNGDDVNFFKSKNFPSQSPWGLLNYQGLIGLNFTESLYYMFHNLWHYGWDAAGKSYIYSNETYRTNIVNKNGEQSVENTNELITPNTLSPGGFNAVKHANGRNWWVVLRKIEGDDVKTLLVTPDTIIQGPWQNLGMDIKFSYGLGGFSLDGSKWYFQNIKRTFTQNPPFENSYVADFDRATGLFSNMTEIYSTPSVAGQFGIAMSPNKRFVYLSNLTALLQYDLEDPSSPPDTVGVYDGFKSPYGSRFFYMQMGLDQKIYMCTTNGETILHVINNPNGKGKACDFRQHSVNLMKNNAFSLPNFPYYRLGPLDGSAADTLGINNEAKAWFRYYTDEKDAKLIHFIDLSYYEPTEWYWEFDDGQTSTEREPIHSYAKSGKHYVCLTVSNAYSTDKFCMNVYTKSTIATYEHLEGVSVHPNPFAEYFTLQLREVLSYDAELTITDLLGRTVLTQTVLSGTHIQMIDTPPLASGAYLLHLVKRGKVVFVQKIVKI